MIADPYAASLLYSALLKAQGTLNSALVELWPLLDKDEREMATTAVASIFAEVLISGMSPLEHAHPGLYLPKEGVAITDCPSI
ncbi:hypothetical protein [Caballeronia sp. ATUFL_F1_KS4A]|uniref:hypothetical protein n=1 Tax=Caballeronia sp. ATUFL_F1_KS4A TaxID=2921768 RepID=UPI0020295C43|nr:hypothetical protein [Caballeronia sp. ATUFL_F1_KS4A]